MAFFLNRRKPKKHVWTHLEEKFSDQTKSSPKYTQTLQGLDLRNANAHKTLEEFSAADNPCMFLHIPGESYEEFREYRLLEVQKDILLVQNISLDTSCEDFLRNYAPIRFSFRFQYYLFFFETTAQGKVDGENCTFALQIPDTVYQERRSHQRYRLLPDYKALLNDMPVADISQKGISFLSPHHLGKQNTLDNAVLVLPPVYCSSEDICYFEGQQITIPQIIIANNMKEKRGYRYGGYFPTEWPEKALKTLNDFLLALRKKAREDAENV